MKKGKRKDGMDLRQFFQPVKHDEVTHEEGPQEGLLTPRAKPKEPMHTLVHKEGNADERLVGLKQLGHRDDWLNTPVGPCATQKHKEGNVNQNIVELKSPYRGELLNTPLARDGAASKEDTPSLLRLGTPARAYSRRKKRTRVLVDELDVLEAHELVPESGIKSCPIADVVTERKNEAEKSPKVSKYKQLYLDLGQADFGHTKCNICGLVYTLGEPKDEKIHNEYHSKFLRNRGK